MFYKCELLVGGYAYAVTDHIKNWDDMTVSFKRNEYDGVVRTFTDKFEFVKGARQLLLGEYRDNYLKASASVVLSTRNNSWTWTERFRCALDFSTLSDDGFTLSINAVDDSVASLIKAKKGTEYEYSVNQVKDSKPLLYDGLEVVGNTEWIYTGENVVKDNINVFTNTFTEGYTTLPLYIKNSEIPIKGSVEVADVEQYNSDGFGLLMPPFFRVIKPIQVAVPTDFLFVRYVCDFSFQAQWNGKGTCKMMLMNDPVFTDGVIWEKNITSGMNDVVFDIQKYVVGILDRNVYLVMHLTDGAVCEIWQPESSNQTLVVEYKDRRSPEYIDVIKPVTLLNRLLKSMNGGKDGLTGVIVSSGDKRLDNAMLLAAESVRKLPRAKLRSSFSKFSQWMSAVFGYVYDINGSVVTFRHRNDYFQNVVVKVIENYSGYQMNVNSSLIFSQLNIGYEKQEYDSVNGKDEFRFTNIYNTGLNLTDNKLELISPYRADAYGIEFLTQKIGEDTTDNESDNNVFFVCVNDGDEVYSLDRSDEVSGVISPSTMFNVMYSPTSMIKANQEYLGGFISELNYASSEGNTDVVINGLPESRDLTLQGGLFKADVVDVETSDVEVPENMTGIVMFEHQGQQVQGFYQSADFNYTKNKSAKISLIVKNNT